MISFRPDPVSDQQKLSIFCCCCCCCCAQLNNNNKKRPVSYRPPCRDSNPQQSKPFGHENTGHHSIFLIPSPRHFSHPSPFSLPFASFVGFSFSIYYLFLPFLQNMLQNALLLFFPENDSRKTGIPLLYQVVLTFIV